LTQVLVVNLLSVLKATTKAGTSIVERVVQGLYQKILTTSQDIRPHNPDHLLQRIHLNPSSSESTLRSAPWEVGLGESPLGNPAPPPPTRSLSHPLGILDLVRFRARLSVRRAAILTPPQGSMTMSQGSIAGRSFLFTGKLTHFTRSAGETAVREAGGVVASRVTASLSYLVVGEKAGSKLTAAQKIPSVQILSEEEFVSLIGRDV
jgi:NAD-dependent DNA ligase